jgi:hypothetical protein
VDLRAGLKVIENWKFLALPGLQLRPLGRPARSQSLYRLRYRDSLKAVVQASYVRCIQRCLVILCYISPVHCWL